MSGAGAYVRRRMPGGDASGSLGCGADVRSDAHASGGEAFPVGG